MIECGHYFFRNCQLTLQHVIQEEEEEDNHQCGTKHGMERELCLWHLACFISGS